MHRISSHSRLGLASTLNPPSLFAPAGCCVASCCTASASQRAASSRVASCGTFALHPPARPLLHRHFFAPSLGPTVIASILKCTAHSPDGGIANGHCSLSYGFRPPTRLPAPPHCHLHSSTIHHPCPTLVKSWRKMMTWRLFVFV